MLCDYRSLRARHLDHRDIDLAEINLSEVISCARDSCSASIKRALLRIFRGSVLRRTGFIRSRCSTVAFLVHDFCHYLSRHCGRGERYSRAYPNRAVTRHVTRKSGREDNISSWREEAGRFVRCTRVTRSSGSFSFDRQFLSSCSQAIIALCRSPGSWNGKKNCQVRYREGRLISRFFERSFSTDSGKEKRFKAGTPTQFLCLLAVHPHSSKFLLRVFRPLKVPLGALNRK